MRPRDLFELSVCAGSFEVAPGELEQFDEAVITINGRELLDIIREAEVPFAKAEGHPGLAGSYQGLPTDLAFWPSKHLLGEPDSLYLVRSGDVYTPAVLVCECGEPGCWPLGVRIEVKADVVVWSDFEQPYRRGEGDGRRAWSYDCLGPFEFDRSSYEQALHRNAD